MAEVVSLRIEGLTCMGCVTTVRNALEQVPNTCEVKVDLDSGKASMNFEGDVQSLITAVSRTGKKAELIETEGEKRQFRLKVEDLSCMGCVGSVSEALSKLKGASDVKVDLESGLASVAFGGTVEDVLEAVRETGKTVRAL
ncbi:unnamed protein product [Agarophyton chilense]